MQEQFSRTALICGEAAIARLNSSRAAVFGLGGVGGICAEALVRSGLGTIDIIDTDIITITNLNRQITALHSTLGQYKTDAAKQRFEDINPQIKVNAYNIYFGPGTQDVFDFSVYDYIIDAVDTVTSKIELAVQAQKANVPIISCMGAGNKTDPSGFMVSDIYSTSVCPLARIMRHELRKRNIEKLKVVYSRELPSAAKGAPPPDAAEGQQRKTPPGSNAFVPAAAGLILAGEVINDLTAAFMK